jgi:hypothetical protein
MTRDEMTGDEMTRDEMTGDEMTRDEMTGDKITRSRCILTRKSSCGHATHFFF